MKVKLDENLGGRIQTLFEGHGHDTATVIGQGLQGAPDDRVFEVCRAEERVLITLDLDFANPYRYEPSQTAGVAVMRVPSQSRYQHIELAARRLLAHLESHQIRGQLWVVHGHLVRQFEP